MRIHAQGNTSSWTLSSVWARDAPHTDLIPFFWLAVSFPLNSCREQSSGAILEGCFPGFLRSRAGRMCNFSWGGCAVPEWDLFSQLCVCWWLEHVLRAPTSIYSWQFLFASPFANKNLELEWGPTLHSRSAASPCARWLFALTAFPAGPRASPAKNGYKPGTLGVGNVGFKSCSFFCRIRGVQPSSKSHPHPGAGLVLGKTLHFMPSCCSHSSVIHFAI